MNKIQFITFLFKLKFKKGLLKNDSTKMGNNTQTSIFVSDDLITPVYVAPTRSPVTLKPKSHKETVPERPSCDDEEECEEGSGDPGTTEQMFVTSATGN